MLPTFIAPKSGAASCNESPMEKKSPAPDPMTHARKLIDDGWRTNMATESVTRQRDQKTGLVEVAVWEAMKYLQAAAGWVRTEPQEMTPSDPWEKRGA
jgi:hypothetical protein